MTTPLGRLRAAEDSSDDDAPAGEWRVDWESGSGELRWTNTGSDDHGHGNWQAQQDWLKSGGTKTSWKAYQSELKASAKASGQDYSAKPPPADWMEKWPQHAAHPTNGGKEVPLGKSDYGYKAGAAKAAAPAAAASAPASTAVEPAKPEPVTVQQAPAPDDHGIKYGQRSEQLQGASKPTMPKSTKANGVAGQSKLATLVKEVGGGTAQQAKGTVAAQVAAAMDPKLADSLIPSQWKAAASAGNVGVSLNPWTGTLSRVPLTTPKDLAAVKAGGTKLTTVAAGARLVMATSPRGQQMMREAVVSELVRTWAATSNDSNPKSLAMQEAAAREFGLVNHQEWGGNGKAYGADPQKVQDATNEELDKRGAAYQNFLRAQYNVTQKVLADRGIKSVNLYRGFRFGSANSGTAPKWADAAHKSGGKVSGEVPLRPLSSFSYRATTAKSFSSGYGTSVVISGNVPATRILSCAATGFGCKREGEVVVIAGPGTYNISAPNLALAK